MSKVKVNNYDLYSSLLDTKQKLVFLSDIHNETSKFIAITNKIKECEPSMIIIGGDLGNSASESHAEINELLCNFRIIAPTVVTIGNKDQMDSVDSSNVLDIKWRENTNKEWYKNIEKCDCELLSDKFNRFDYSRDLSVIAMNPPFEWYEGQSESMENFIKYYATIPSAELDPERFNIVVCHSPNGLITKKGNLISCNELPLLKNASIVLSGHNHAALVPNFLRNLMPKNMGIINPQSKVLQPNMYGVYTNNEGQYLINSGGITKLASNTGFLHKFDKFYSTEIEIIDLIPASEEHNILKLVKK